MKFSYFLILFDLFVVIVHGQGITSIVDNSTNPGEVLVEFDTRSSQLEGHYFINKDWQKSDIYLKSGFILSNMQTRFDLEYDILEVNIDEKIKVIPLHKLTKFTYYKDTSPVGNYVNCEYYKYNDNTPLTGICEVLDTCFYGVILKYGYEIKEATYVPALDMGSQSAEIIVETDVLLTKGRIFLPLPKNRNKFLDFYAPYDSLKVFMKENKLNHKKREDLQQILDYVNEANR